MSKMTGYVDKIIYQSGKNGFNVASFITQDKATDTEVELTITGKFIQLKEGDYLTIEGYWTDHMVYGEQFSVQKYKPAKPASEDGLRRYLSSGILPGVGKKTAKLLIQEYGNDFFDVLENDPDDLLKIPGIGKKSLEKIKKAYQEQKGTQDIMLELSEYEISPAIAKKLFDIFGDNAANVVRDDPYQLPLKVPGIGFKRADEIALRLGHELNDPKRILSGLIYAISDCYQKGNTFISEEELLETAARLLDITEEEALSELDEAVDTGKIIRETLEGERIYYPVDLYQAERSAAESIVKLLQSDNENPIDYFDELLDEVEEDLSFSLDENQRQALQEVFSNNMTIITGGPGVGKTSMIQGIVSLCKKEGLSVALAAPTGRAAQRITQTTGEPAKTIHRLLEYEFTPEDTLMNFKRGKDQPLEEQVIIIDESSMVDIELFAKLLEAVSPGSRLILVGDKDQLPSVGPGNVLSDLIQTGLIPTANLTQIHRQEEGSMISINAHIINEGNVPEIDNNTDFMLVNKNDDKVALQTILDLVSSRMPRVFGFDRLKDIQVISPLKKGLLGTISLNNELQQVLNPASPVKREKVFGDTVFREGDKVMQIKNNYNLHWENASTGQEGEGIFNGDIGTIQHMEDKGFVVQFTDGRMSEYGFDQLDELSLAYAVTVHKSQGSEFKAVIMPLMGGYPGFLNKRLLYTAVTRAKNKLLLIGQSRYFDFMIANGYFDIRNTLLTERIQALYNNESLFEEAPAHDLEKEKAMLDDFFKNV